MRFERVLVQQDSGLRKHEKFRVLAFRTKWHGMAYCVGEDTSILVDS
jgi:hypothetical protein